MKLDSITRRFSAGGAFGRGLVFLLACSSLTLGASAQIAEKGALLLHEDFRQHAVFTKERLPVAPGWEVRVAHGIWQRSESGVQSTWETGHSPVLVYEGSFGDVIIEVDFRYRAEPGKWAACRISATNPELFPRAYAVSVWANVDFKSRGRGFLIENDVWGGHITRAGYRKADYEPDTWYTVRLEVVGNRASAECNGIRVTGTHDKFGIPKTSIWLATGMSLHELRNLRVYAAQPILDGPSAAPVAATK
jgi:hypothetical protein